MLHTYSCKTLKSGLAKYAVDANLFRLGSTNSEKNSQALDFHKCFKHFQKCSYIFKQNYYYIFKSVQIYMKDVESVESKEKSDFSDFYFSSYGNF